MNNKLILATMLLLAAAIGSPEVFAGPAQRVVAATLIHLDHAPTDAETPQLKQIANDPNAAPPANTLAYATPRLHHTVTDEDKPTQAALAKDPAAPEEERTLANVLL